MLENLEPKIVWKYFEEICKIPRCSKHEEKIAEYIMEVAKKHGLEVEKDEVGNVVARKKANGYENAPMITLQCHMDMVCEKNKDVEHDFSKDPIQPYVDGEWVKAEGTTLGADNGIGLAMCLALMEEKNIKHGPLEFLFTVDEETGLTGAFNLKKEFIKGELLINLDSEDFGVIYIGCAGGGNSTIKLPVRFENVEKEGLRIHVKGLKGGHSGIEIDKGRANSIKLLARILYNINARISKIEGGDKHNAIPREAIAEVVVDGNVMDKIKELEAAFKNEYSKTEPDLKVEVENCKITKVIDEESNKKLIKLLMGLPHGVIAMSQEVEGLVETSTNLATIRMNDEATIVMSSRSSVNSALDALMQSIRCIGELAGASVEEGSKYPGWKPNLESRLLKIASDAFKELYGKEPEKKAIHAGLETGVIGDITGINEIISIGPQIEHPHSPDERVHIKSVEEFWKYLLHLLEKVAKEW
ncbi:MAG TPA: aminoacyl-histidine dipeptidase [Thermoplasmatales archaeon]|nr:aminoacyl-histidine dipeptidase [Thermoplasmatales archaeon]